jgi:hypothetical protein
MDLVERCERVLAQNTEGASARGWRDAIAAARRGDGAGAAEALAALPEKPRFAATVVLGLAFPSVLVASAQASIRRTSAVGPSPSAQRPPRIIRPGDKALVDAIEAVGHVRANDRGRSSRRFSMTLRCFRSKRRPIR